MKHKLFILACTAILILIFSTSALARTFSDIDDNETEAAVEILYNLNIVDGYDDGDYHPDTILTRAQFCKLVLLALDMGDDISTYSHLTLFSDVTSNHWAVGYINLASSLGYINGYGNGFFGPSDCVSYGQTVTIFLRVLGYTSADIGYYWPDDYVNFAEKIGLDADLNLDAYDLVSRGDAAVLLVQFLNTQSATGNNTFFDQIYSDSIESAILLDNDAVSYDGDDDCALFYINGAAVYFEQDDKLSKTLIGCSGTILLDSNNTVLSFVSDDDEEYTVEEGLLFDNSITSPDGERRTAMFYIDGDIEYYQQSDILDANFVGSYGYILLNDNDYVTAFIIVDDESYSIKKDVWLLDATSSKAWVYNESEISRYGVASRLSSSLNGSFGALLLNEDDEIDSFIVYDNIETDAVTIMSSTPNRLYFNSTQYYNISLDQPVIYDDIDEGWIVAEWEDVYEDAGENGNLPAIIYFDDDGGIDLIIFLESIG